jgi:hypothetical protein
MAHFLNSKMWGKNLLYILSRMRIQDKPCGINFELGAYLQIVLQLESLIAN